MVQELVLVVADQVMQRQINSYAEQAGNERLGESGAVPTEKEVRPVRSAGVFDHDLYDRSRNYWAGQNK